MAKLFGSFHSLSSLLCSSPLRTAPEKPDPSIRVQMRAFERAVQGCGDLDKSPHPCVTYRVTWPEITHSPTPAPPGA
jgi:hypothetical protein